MSLQEFDLIQRIKVEDGVPRVISTTIKVIEGGDNLLSQAINLLDRMGFYDKFQEQRKSQYVGFKLKNAPVGKKRYQLILVEKQQELCASISQEIFEKSGLDFGYWEEITGRDFHDIGWFSAGRIYVLPKQKALFLESLSPQYWDLIDDDSLENTKRIEFNKLGHDHDTYEPICVLPNSEIISRKEFNVRKISDPASYVILEEDRLFPHTWKVCIKSSEILQEFISYCGQILMEQN